MQPTADQFTEKGWAAIVLAQQLAQQRKHQQLETEHLLLSLLEQNALAGRILEKAGVSIGNLQTAVEAHLHEQPTNLGISNKDASVSFFHHSEYQPRGC